MHIWHNEIITVDTAVTILGLPAKLLPSHPTGDTHDCFIACHLKVMFKLNRPNCTLSLTLTKHFCSPNLPMWGIRWRTWPCLVLVFCQIREKHFMDWETVAREHNPSRNYQALLGKNNFALMWFPGIKAVYSQVYANFDGGSLWCRCAILLFSMTPRSLSSI